MSTIFFTSDQHFFHERIIDYEKRPFQTPEQMNGYMLQKWNSRVSKKDKVFFLGDLCIPSQKYSEIIAMLNGYKIMIMGNHDSLSHKRYLEAGFDEVSRYPVILDGLYILSHAPCELCADSPFMNIHGHSHGTRGHGAKHFNVSVELHDYTPVKYADIAAYFTEQMN
jgi:calcineurin-like phosphoesterase family protein